LPQPHQEEQDTDRTLADQVLAEILALDPANSQARHTRHMLHLRAGWLQDAG
jgi:hypothetical protein